MSRFLILCALQLRAPAPTGKRPLAVSKRSATEQEHNPTIGAPMPRDRSVENPSAQSSAAMAVDDAEKLTYSGRVFNDDGEPIADAEIRCAVNWETTQLITRTAADGSFRFELMRPQPGCSNCSD